MTDDRDETALTLAAAEREVRDIYLWWHEQAPGVTPREEGLLADLWRFVSHQYEIQKRDMTPDEARYEFGVS